MCYKKELTLLDSDILTLKIDTITKPNMIKCVEKQGLYDLYNETYGNLYIKFKIIYPDILTEEQKLFINKYF